MPLFYHKYVNYVLAHSVNYVITLYRLAPPVAPILVVSTNLCKRTLITCLARSSRCTEPLNPHNLLKSTSTASHHVLASPRKRGGGTAVEVFQLAVQYSDSPAFTILKLSRAVTVGIAPYPHQPSQTRTIPRKPPTPLPP